MTHQGRSPTLIRLVTDRVDKSTTEMNPISLKTDAVSFVDQVVITEESIHLSESIVRIFREEDEKVNLI